MVQTTGKTALILAGGGIMGAAYEIGALTALDRLFRPGFSSRHFDLYIGISAGAVIGTLLANRIEPAGLFRAIAKNERSVFNFGRKDIYRIDHAQMFRSTCRFLRQLLAVAKTYHQRHWRLTWHEISPVLQEQFPAGLFSLAPLENYLREAFRKEGVYDQFSQLKTELYIPAYDLDSGKRVVFGQKSNRDVEICEAITASCAIPFFFRPHKVAGRFFVDGSVGRLCHLDLAIERGANLLIIVNSRVPMDNNPQHNCLPSLSFGRCSQIANLGISLTWEQAQRIEHRNRLEMEIADVRQRHPNIDIILIEPGRDVSLLFFQKPMSGQARHHVMNQGYHLTLEQLRADYTPIREIMARHGIRTTDRNLSAEPPAILAERKR